MSNRVKIFIVLVLLGFALVAYVTSNFFSPQSDNNSDAPFTVEPPPKIEIEPFIPPQDDKIITSEVEMNNFYKTSPRIDITGDALVTSNSNNLTGFYIKGELFLVSVKESPFVEARVKAEQEFIEKLGITEEDACKLNVVVNTPAYANPKEAGKNHPLSFCEK